MKKGSTLQGTFNKFFRKKNRGPSLFTPNRPGILPVSSEGTEIQNHGSLDQILTSGTYADTFSTPNDPGTAKVKARPTVKIFPQTPTNSLPESQGFPVPTPSVPELSSRNETATSQVAGNGLSVNGDNQTYASVGNFKHYSSVSYYMEEDIPPPPSMAPPPPPLLMKLPHSPSAYKPAPPKFAPPKPPPSLPEPSSPLEAPAPPSFTAPKFPPATLLTSQANKETNDSPSSFTKNSQPPKFAPPPPPQQKPTLQHPQLPLPLRTPQSTPPRTPKLPPPKPARFSSIPQQYDSPVPSFQHSPQSTWSSTSSDSMQNSSKSAIPSSFNPKTEAKVFSPVVADQKSAADRQNKSKSMLIMQDFPTESPATNARHGVTLDNGKVNANKKENISSIQNRAGTTKPAKPARKNNLHTELPEKPGKQDRDYEHCDDEHLTFHQNKINGSNEWKNAIPISMNSSDGIVAATEDKSRSFLVSEIKKEDTNGIVTPAVDSKSTDNTTVESDRPDGTLKDAHKIPEPLFITSSTDMAQNKTEFTHPITGDKLEPRSPMALLLAAKQRAQRSSIISPEPQNNVKISLGTPDSSPTSFHYNESNPNSFVVTPRAQQKDNFASVPQHSYLTQINNTLLNTTNQEKTDMKTKEFPNHLESNYGVSTNRMNRTVEESESPLTKQTVGTSDSIKNIFNATKQDSINAKQSEDEEKPFDFEAIELPPPVSFMDEENGEVTLMTIPPPPEFSNDDDKEDNSENKVPDSFAVTQPGDMSSKKPFSIYNRRITEQSEKEKTTSASAERGLSRNHIVDSQQEKSSDFYTYNKKTPSSNLPSPTTNYSKTPKSLFLTSPFLNPKPTVSKGYTRSYKPVGTSASSTSINAPTTVKYNKSQIVDPTALSSRNVHMKTNMKNELQSKIQSQNSDLSCSRHTKSASLSKPQPSFGMRFTVRPGTKHPITILEKGE
ncbi:uncharacterized protein C6orf132 homolog [Latimeria chalumnae]|uniref:uncharacterized protein C6orf132 homolog n=1 Tax=Latimeria chalumnae TaxID=7897 RepID=UPI0003C192A2|nr:PREDICTED: uncharacterized protein C6orf132 homolog [Latimeria chalumnae]|eukprot:XP_005987715.1 PREDICTED: uncharacterized protein C6orf132 homolog [Latimeria chalumnae]